MGGIRVALRDKIGLVGASDKVEKRSTWNILSVRECTYNKITMPGGMGLKPRYLEGLTRP
ncbi:MAG TPA: hypothetical protein VK639_02625 [Terriglobales bacterium]|nr:hypothetical protein [Terriglobales bacterium]